MDLIFARYGGLSPVDYKPMKGVNPFHKPPRRKGIYAFLYPHIESFLWAWNETKYNNVKSGKDRLRKFTYNGPVWCHFGHLFKDHPTSGAWVLLSIDEYKQALKTVRKEDHKGSSWINKNRKHPYIVLKNPYHSHGGCSTDHLEVFIESNYLGKIR